MRGKQVVHRDTARQASPRDTHLDFAAFAPKTCDGRTSCYKPNFVGGRLFCIGPNVRGHDVTIPSERLCGEVT